MAILVTFAVADAQRPDPPLSLALEQMTIQTATPTTTPDWWQGLAFALPTLEKLPGAPMLSLDGVGGFAGAGANQPVTYLTVTCPRTDVRINRITTGARHG